MNYPSPMDIAESEDKAINALDEALDWPYSREAWDQVDADRLELLAVNDALALEVERMTAHAKVFAERLAELQSAAWDVCDVVQDALDTPEDADMKSIQAAIDAMGELIPAQRPTDRENDAHG